MVFSPFFFKSSGVGRLGLCCILLVLALSSCNVTKYMDDTKGERLLVKNSLVLRSEKRLKLSEKTPLTYELGGLYKQKPNSKTLFLFRTRLWFHYKYKGRDNNFGRWVNKRVAEEPVFYDDALTQRTALNFANTMHQRGYLKAKCTYKTEFPGKHFARTTYTLDLGPLYTIGPVDFFSRDTGAQRVLWETGTNCQLRPGSPLDGRAFEAEKLRIVTEMRNRGYAYFGPNSVEFVGDSTGTSTAVTVTVLPPADNMRHQKYQVGKVAVFSSLVPNYSSIRKDTTIGKIYFASSDPNFRVRPKQLLRAIAIRPDTLYRQEDFEKTVRQLNALGVFRFVSVKPSLDTLKKNVLDATISFSPNKRLSFGGDIDLNSSTSSVSGRLLGVSSSLTLLNRNLMRGAEMMQNNLGYNVEFDITQPDRLIFSQEFKFQNQLIIPRYFGYLGVWPALRGAGLVSPRLYRRMKNEGQMHIKANYNYLELIDYYAYNLFNASFGADLRTDPEHVYSFDYIGIDVLRPRLYPNFDSITLLNPFLRLSFSDQLFTGFLLRSFTYSYVGGVNRFGERWALRFNTDLSGVEILGLNALWSAAFGKQTWELADMEFASYIRADFDAVYTRDFNKKGLTGAVRIGAGAIMPFGKTETTPYVKQFFVGGPSSIRAWRVREIGPGGYRDTRAPLNPPFYQASDFRFEFNGELRFPFFWWFKGAVFVDGGNVWSLDPDDPRPGARLDWNAYKNIALGTGFGVRADFGFFIIRLDWGLPLRYPYPVNKESHWVPNRISHLQWRDFNLNLAVGYPF